MQSNKQHTINRVVVMLTMILTTIVNSLARCVYVSSTTGNDSNFGMSADFPLYSITKAKALGDTILLRCGDIFYESIDVDGKYISHYGKGANPIICGYKRIKNIKWIQEDDNIWKILLTGNNFIGWNSSGSSLLNNIGSIHEFDKNELHGRKVQYKNELKENWDIYQAGEKHGQKKYDPSDFNYLYLYLNSDPNLLNLEFSVGCSGMIVNNSIVDGIDIEGFGCHGINGGTHTIIQNCRIDAIGGMIQLGYPTYVCLGNGIEFYISRDKSDCQVRNCTISRCYDCGITIQGADHGKATPRNILIEKNLVYNCCQGWEDFLRNDDDVVFENCIVRDNTFILNGHTNGFAYPKDRFKFCHVLGNNTKGNKGLTLMRNTFIGGNLYCSGAYYKQYKSNLWLGNTCYIERGDFLLANYTGTKDVIRIPKGKGQESSLKNATRKAIAFYREKTGDNTTRFIICSPKKILRVSKRHMRNLAIR